MKISNIKRYLPPILFEKLFNVYSYINFLQYSKIIRKNKNLFHIHKGERCFLLGSGPSIKYENLKPLKDEYVIALNNFYVHPDFHVIMHKTKPKYYMIAPNHKPQAENVWKNWLEDMQNKIPNHVMMFFGLNSYKKNLKFIIDKYNLFKNFNKSWYYAGVYIDDYYIYQHKHIDISRMIWSAETVSIYALILAIYMGFTQIYLLGMDHNYFLYKTPQSMRMYSNAIHQHDENTEIEQSYDKFFVDDFCAQGRIFKKYYMLKYNVDATIINLSNESVLNLFEKQKLNDIL